MGDPMYRAHIIFRDGSNTSYEYTHWKNEIIQNLDAPGKYNGLKMKQLKKHRH